MAGPDPIVKDDQYIIPLPHPSSEGLFLVLCPLFNEFNYCMQYDVFSLNLDSEDKEILDTHSACILCILTSA
jgi:hypothetical protein